MYDRFKQAAERQGWRHIDRDMYGRGEERASARGWRELCEANEIEPATITTRTATAPSYWASALVNDDESGLTTDEVAAMNKWLEYELESGEYVAGVEGEEFFSNATLIGRNEWFAGTVIEYVILGVPHS